MFEFHAWATIRVNEDDDPQLDILSRREDQALERLRPIIDQADDEFSFFDLRRTGNGMIVFTSHGLRNHRFQPIIDVFSWIGENLPESYGLLYVHDDESEVHDNEFRVWRLARGQLTELDDPFLSPYVPTVEQPWEPAE